jgi:hypothetical protein
VASVVSHGACGIRWTQVANQTGHCGGCHETFSSLKAFDLHQRITVTGDLVCKDPATLSLDGFELVGRPDRNTGITVWGKSGEGRPRVGKGEGSDVLVEEEV